jgi:hypothetical protein
MRTTRQWFLSFEQRFEKTSSTFSCENSDSKLHLAANPGHTTPPSESHTVTPKGLPPTPIALQISRLSTCLLVRRNDHMLNGSGRRLLNQKRLRAQFHRDYVPSQLAARGRKLREKSLYPLFPRAISAKSGRLHLPRWARNSPSPGLSFTWSLISHKLSLLGTGSPQGFQSMQLNSGSASPEQIWPISQSFPIKFGPAF